MTIVADYAKHRKAFEVICKPIKENKLIVEEKVPLETIPEKKEEKSAKLEKKVVEMEKVLEEMLEIKKPLARPNFPLVVKTSGPRAKKEEKEEKEVEVGVEKPKKSVTFAATVEAQEDEDTDDEDPLMNIFDTKALKKGIAEFEAEMSPFVKLNILFIQIGTREF